MCRYNGHHGVKVRSLCEIIQERVFHGYYDRYDELEDSLIVAEEYELEGRVRSPAFFLKTNRSGLK